MFEIRGGEIALPVDPATAEAEAGLVFIGRIRSPWISRAECPKNMREARERGVPASVEIDATYRPGLLGLTAGAHVFLITWLANAPRNLIVQKPRHATEAKGVFALRSPARPNPLGLHLVRLESIEPDAGLLGLDGIDALDGTPIVDVKPWFGTVDAVPAVAAS